MTNMDNNTHNRINKLQEHSDKLCRFLELSDGLYFSPDTGQSFTADETYLNLTDCYNCGRGNWHPGNIIGVNDRNCCVICNKYVVIDSHGDNLHSDWYTVNDVHTERLRAEKICENDG